MNHIMITDNPIPDRPGKRYRVVLWLVFTSLLIPGLGKADSTTPNEAASEVATAPVIVDGMELFRVRGVSAFPARKRADIIAERIRTIAADRSILTDTLTIIESDQSSNIMAGDLRIISLFDADAKTEDVNRKTLATVYKARIGEVIESYRQNRTSNYLLRSALYSLTATIAFVIFLWLGSLAMRRIDHALDVRVKAKLEGIESQSKRILNSGHMWSALRGVRNLVWTLIVLAVVLLYLNFVLQQFPWTRYLGLRLLDMIIDPLNIMGKNILESIPNIAFLIILTLVIRYILKAIRLFFASVELGTVKLASFDPEWAWPTFRLIRLLMIAFAVVIAFPYIPGSDSGAFKGVSLFLGVIFSIGSTSVISNMIAGYSLIYRRAFRIGDRVKIDEHLGDVTQSRLLVTHLLTPKNEEVIIPNSVILNGSVINYSTLAREGKLILYATVGIGYETPWRQVEAMLLQAAEHTAGLLKEPKPFVLQKALGDFCVTYEVNVYCDNAHGMGGLYTSLYQNILDVFNEYGIQIMTPAYEGDPEQPKIVPRDQWYAPPANKASPHDKPA
jgi:small-conductance mechanosensitive channel